MSVTTAPPHAPAASTRIASLDLLRGVIMVLMAVDHVRVYSGVPAGGPEAAVFFTRWITHFCAPGFVFLAGTAAYFSGLKLADRGVLSRYLLVRGVILVLLELTVIKLAWTFNVATLSSPLAGVIWMLGWCMVLMAMLVRLPTRTIGIVGVAIVVAQDALRPLAATMPESLQWIAQFLYLGGPVPLTADGATIVVLYSIVPWIGVMAAGYAFGEIVRRPAAERTRLCLRVGLSMTALFLLVGGAAVVLAPAGDGTPALFQLLNQRKYPASQLYLLMTLGPLIAAIPLVERARGWLGRAFVTFGRVPFFYYLLHIPLIHAVALLVWVTRDGGVNTGWFDSAPFVAIGDEQRWSLGLLYLVFAAVVALLYFPCAWFADVKRRGTQAWLRYL